MEPREYSDDELDNHANQLNPNNDAYYSSRGLDDDDDDNSNDTDDDYDESLDADGGWESADY